MTSRTKRINRAMTTPITDAMETGSEIKRNYMNYEIIHNSILIFFGIRMPDYVRENIKYFQILWKNTHLRKKMVYLTKF